MTRIDWSRPGRATRRGALMATAAVAVAASGFAGGEAQAKTRWQMHSAFGSNVAVLGPPAWRVADYVKRMSGGDFAIRVEEPGALVGGFAYYDGVSQGAMDAAYGTPAANQGKNSAFAFLSTWPFGPAAPEFMAWFKYGGGNEIASDLYARDDIHFILCGMVPPETSGWFRKEIKSLDDLKGLKMRFFGVGAKVMQKFGVSTQQLAGGDIYPALELGTIDATEFSMPAVDRSYGFHQIAKYNYFPGWHQQSTAGEFIVNAQSWKDLSDAEQAMVEVACDANLSQQISDGEASQYQAMIDDEKDGVHLMDWTDEELAQFRAAWEEVLQEEIAANPDVKTVWDSYSAFHDKYKVWGSRGYLKLTD